MGTENIPTGGSPVERIVRPRPDSPEAAYETIVKLARDAKLVYQDGGGVVVVVHPTTQHAEGIFADIQRMNCDYAGARASGAYSDANPLGGPATMFDTIANRIRAGEQLDFVLTDYGLQFMRPNA